MRNKIPFIAAFCTVLIFSIAGLFKLKFETDILDVLPQKLSSVRTLKISQKYFDNDQRIALLLSSEEEEIYEEDVEEFAIHLREKLSPAKVLYRSEFEEDPEQFAKSIAGLWLLSPPEISSAIENRLLDQSSLEKYLETVKNDIRTSFDQQEATIASYDPLGFLKHPFITQLKDSELSFQSADGKHWILLIHNPTPTTDYHVHQAWVEKIRSAANSWAGLEDFGFTFGLTGGPVYNSEIGTAMEEDMSGTIMFTSILVGVLFLLVQRHPGQLMLILLLLGLSFVITLGVGGWIFGTLNLVSVGFAAILLGLIIDYGVVIFRESIGNTESPARFRKELAPGILWAAATTAIVFGLLTLSTFQGVRQLGGLIIIGLITGAAVMLIFIPLFLNRFPSKNASILLKSPFPGKLVARSLIACGILIAIAVFAVKGEPDVSFDFSMVEPSSSEAAATFSVIQEKFPAWSDKNVQLMASGKSWVEIESAAEEAEKHLKNLKANGIVQSYQWPTELIPLMGTRNLSSENFTAIHQSRDRILESAKQNGFTDEGLALDRMILDHLNTPPAEVDLTDFVHQFIAESPDQEKYLSGSVMLTKEVTEENFPEISVLSSENFDVTSWSIIQAALLPSVKRDFYVIFLPATGILLLTLVVVFRSIRDAAITIGVLVTSLLLVNAFVVVTGSAWNFLSGMAIPLIVGTGIDYSIHLIFALRRSGGDLNSVWNGVGKAICFCGLSTAIGFGSLLFASNEILRSMGLLCCLGVLTTMLLSVFVVPGLWKRSAH
ncbi:MMPL family transporter [Luteolibacter sp. AS25]|uniref:MMPL family transporter n=1 Tax=Luteolibacter sp. AS25 TaxID=3135776 RepID=UPI00398AD18B